MNLRMRTNLGGYIVERRIAWYGNQKLGEAPDVTGAIALIRDHAWRSGTTQAGEGVYRLETYRTQHVLVTTEPVEEGRRLYERE